MIRTVRHDALALREGVDVDDFEHFMTRELMPHFAECFEGPTRSSRADLKVQSLLRDTKSARKFLLVTVWDGAASSVAGAAFENARMNTVAQTGALMKKLDGLAKRSTQRVFTGRASTEVATNA